MTANTPISFPKLPMTSIERRGAWLRLKGDNYAVLLN